MSDAKEKPTQVSKGKLAPQVSKIKAEVKVEPKTILPPEPVPSLPPKSLPEGVTLPSPEEFRNCVLKEAGTARVTKKEKKQRAEERLIKVKQFRSDTLQKLFSYLSPFNNQIVNINQPLKIDMNHIEGTLNCNPVFTLSSALVGQDGFQLYIKTDRNETYRFFLHSDADTDVPQNTLEFQDMLKYCQKLLVEALSNS